MANELEHLDATGLTIYAKPLPIGDDAWGDDVEAMSETGTTGYYSADVASPANRYAVYQQAGASAAATDVAVATIDRSAAIAAAQATTAASQTTATAIRGAVGPMVATVARAEGSNVFGPIPRSGLLVVHHPTDAAKVRQWTGTGAPQWVELATATFAECAVSLTQVGTTGIYHAELDLPDDATYPVHLYTADATGFADQVIAQMTWYPELATSAEMQTIKARTDNLPDEPASKDDVQVTIDGGTGTGDIPTIPPAITRDGVGVDNCIIRVYLASDYALGNFTVRAEGVTGPDGVIVAPLMLNAGAYKAVVWDPQARRSQVFDLTVEAT